MSQSASFYSVAEIDFNIIQQSENKELDIAPFVKAYCTLDESYMALEFTLVNNLQEEDTLLIEEIFNPASSFGGSDFSDVDIDNIDPQVLEAMVLNDASVYYISPETVAEITGLLSRINEETIAANYDAVALNENDIFPVKWHNDNNSDLKYNVAHLQKTYRELKSFFAAASLEKDYVLTYIQG
jgi:hypothetical protein